MVSATFKTKIIIVFFHFDFSWILLQCVYQACVGKSISHTCHDILYNGKKNTIIILMGTIRLVSVCYGEIEEDPFTLPRNVYPAPFPGDRV